MGLLRPNALGMMSDLLITMPESFCLTLACGWVCCTDFALDAMMALTGVGIAPHTQAATGPYTSGPDCTTPAASGTEGNCALYRSPEVVSASREL
eukprot:COSAG04_NODE_997_length_8867_cov_22.280908_2_plen_95_part_00